MTYLCIKNTIDLNPDEFLRMKQEHPENIKNTEVIPPVLGTPGFGKFRVTLRVPRYEVNLNGTK
ncbi:MAG: hypothetical protein LBJ36_04745 [Synergistaceae bacterium]|nr:hypothetical protein [Synergistaceae bacterium]